MQRHTSVEKAKGLKICRQVSGGPNVNCVITDILFKQIENQFQFPHLQNKDNSMMCGS